MWLNFNFLIDDNVLYSFGKNTGQCGLNNQIDPILFHINHIHTRKIDGNNKQQPYIVDVAGGWDHALCCSNTGKVYSWGHGYEGTRAVLGHGDKLMRITPTLIKKLSNEYIVNVCAGYDHSLCSSINGDIYSWGWAQNGQLGIGSRKEQVFPCRINMERYGKRRNRRLYQLRLGRITLCLDEDGNAYSWGHGQEYQTGHKISSVLIEPKMLNKRYLEIYLLLYCCW